MLSLPRLALLLCLLLTVALHAAGDNPPPVRTADEEVVEAPDFEMYLEHIDPTGEEKAMERAFDWLERMQAEDGSWFGSPTHTALALMVYVAHGETPLSERRGKSWIAAMQWMIAYADAAPTTALAGAAARDWAIFAYTLSEAYGITRIPALKRVAGKALARVVASQQADGGFPLADPADFGAAGWPILALASGLNVGLDTPTDLKDRRDRAEKWLLETAYHDGRFGPPAAQGTVEPTSIGIHALHELSTLRSPQAKAALERLGREHLAVYREFLDGTRDWRTDAGPLLEGWYHDATAIYFHGHADWPAWDETRSTLLVRTQHADGYWEVATSTEAAPTDADRLLTTAWCMLQHSVILRYRCTCVFRELRIDTVEKSGKGDKSDKGHANPWVF